MIIKYRFWKLEQNKENSSVTESLIKRLFDLLDGLFSFKLNYTKIQLEASGKKYRMNLQQTFSWSWLMEMTSLIVIIGVSAYHRFYDAFIHAAPPMADSYVTLAWMKYIDGRELFHDGIYPQGFHIYLATLFKFAAIDPLYVLRYSGPLNAVLLTVGFYFVIRKLTNNGLGALTSVWLFGIYNLIFPFSSTERQASTNSQEFAFVFIFPAIYFVLKYVIRKNKHDLIVGLICTTIIGLVHSLAFGIVGILIGVIVLSTALAIKLPWKTIVSICIGALITVPITLLPLGAGILLDKEFHSSSADYLTSRNSFTYTTLTNLDYFTLGSLGLLGLLLFIKKRTDEERLIGLFTILAGGCIFIIYYAGGVWTNSTIIATRSSEIWGLMIPFCVGITISYLFNNLKGRWKNVIYFLFVTSLITSIFIYKPASIVPYKLEHNENIEQYLRISNSFRPKTWLIVSQDEGYAISLGKGFHMHLSDFLESYDPKEATLTKRSNGIKDENLPSDIFVFQEKRIFKVLETNSIYTLLEPQYERRLVEYKQLDKWMKIHNDAGFKVESYFENDNIIVYHLQTRKTGSDLKGKVWE
jgi:uncharacterized protein YihD (DUF1040 family)